MEVAREQVLAFRAARHGLAERRAIGLAEAAATPISDFTPRSALLAIAARAEEVTREAYDAATDAGELVLGPRLRGAIHAVAPADAAVFGPDLLSGDDAELAEQLGQQMQRVLGEHGLRASAALEEVVEATADALADGAVLSKDELHEALRRRVRPELMPWCKGCGSHHVAPMLWRYGGVRAGMRMDAERRFLLGAAAPSRGAVEAARRCLRAYGPSTPQDLGAWAGLARTHAKRVWAELASELVEVRLERKRTWLLASDEAALASPPPARGLRLLPPRDPYTQQIDRATLVPDPDVRKRLFRPTASPGAVLQDGRLAGLWRSRAKGRKSEVEVEALGPLDRDALDAEAARVAELRGSAGVVVRCA